MSDAALRRLAAALALAGAAIAGYLTYARYAHAQVVCLTGGGCETVQQSRYSEVVGVPVALLGLGAYAVVLALVVRDGPNERLAAAALAAVGLVFGLYLLAVQLFVIDALCSWCVANDAVVAPLLAAVTIARVVRSSAPGAAGAARSGR